MGQSNFDPNRMIATGHTAEEKGFLHIGAPEEQVEIIEKISEPC